MTDRTEPKPSFGAPMSLRRIFSRAMSCLLVLAGIAIATPSQALVYSQTLYVGIDHETDTAYIYDKDFNRLPDNPSDPSSSIVPLPDTPLWALGFNVDVVRRHADGNIEVVSHLPAYYEMVHHFVMTYVSPRRPTFDACGNRPIATGSELTDVWFSTGYAYKMHGGALVVGDFHWDRPVDIPHPEEVYLRLISVFDDQERGYRDTNITWVNITPCFEDFSVPPGQSEKEGTPLEAPRDLRIIGVGTHTHDHAEYIELRRNGKTLRRFTPEYERAGAVHHSGGQVAIPLHVHEGHLAPQGLKHTWSPGAFGPIIRKGDKLSAFGKFNNPHDHSIDEMVIFPILWEELSQRPQ